MASDEEGRAARAGAAGAAGVAGAADVAGAAGVAGATPGFLPASRELPLFAELPELAGQIPWRPLAHAPTPVVPCAAIEGYLGRGGVWVKRDDRISPLYGGNKVRRFEFLLADAERRGARTLVTVGGLASTQVTATALFGRALGFAVTAVLFDQPITRFGRGALLADAASGAELVHGGGYATTAVRAIRALRRADRPYFILPGASAALPCLGYVDAMLELAEQVRRGEAPRPDRIVVPSGTGGTLAGLALGAAMLGWPTTIVGVRITERVASNRAVVRYEVGSMKRLLARRAPRFTRRRLPPVRFAIDHRAIGPGYGAPTPASIAAIPEVERLIGVPGEITYSAKALAALREIGRDHPGETILLWQTLSSARPPLVEGGAAALPPAFARFFEGDVAC
ncbi:1-aminocyclopropane-1-carboxylate deaminase/D-cysteine desulfhydrase [Sorangium sp. So ce861]|uniref:1-aminocyclopropane-1-carboxylate deaminase/D-cysteine desulfhydrase n=1 Tax=Sorangium sp. So ce861 TaxID=3133323 RepID=UPI003F61A11A